MSCFWDAILQAIGPSLKKREGISSPPTLLAYFKRTNAYPERVVELTPGSMTVEPTVLWQGRALTEKQMAENLKWIEEYNPANVTNGHLTSVCDPFLILLAHDTDVDIEHKYLDKHAIRYTSNFNHAKRLLRFQSNSGHFRFVGRE